MLDSNLILKESRQLFEELLNGPIPVFIVSMVSESFTSLLENSQREQTIASVLCLLFYTKWMSL